jgi:hypothetical protein
MHRLIWNVRVENCAHKHGERCQVTFTDAETSAVLAGRTFDCRFVNRATIRELATLLNVKYRSELQRVTGLSRILQRMSRQTIRRIGGINGRTRLHRFSKNP